MLNILDQIGQWIKEFLIECITGNLSGLFDQVNEAVGDVAADVGKTPQDWNAGVFSMIRSLSDNVIVPIAGIILTFVLCYELISMITEKNNMHDFDTFNIFKWIFKVFVATYLVSHTFDITMAIFELSQNVVRQSAGVITGNTSIQFDAVMGSLTAQLETMGNGELFGLLVETVLIRITTPILSVCVMLVLVGRMVEIYIYCSVGAIPFATMALAAIGNMERLEQAAGHTREDAFPEAGQEEPEEHTEAADLDDLEPSPDKGKEKPSVLKDLQEKKAQAAARPSPAPEKEKKVHEAAL